MRKLKDYTSTQFMAEDSHYDKAAADYAVNFIDIARYYSRSSQMIALITS